MDPVPFFFFNFAQPLYSVCCIVINYLLTCQFPSFILCLYAGETIYAQNIEGLLNAKCWDSTRPNEHDDLLRREEIDNKQKRKDSISSSDECSKGIVQEVMV